METYRERKQRVYRVYAKALDDDRRPTLGDQALPTCLTFVADALSGIGAVLDLGCGAGDLPCTLGTLLGEKASCVGVDLSHELVVVAQVKIAECPHTYVIQTDVTQPLPFADETFDLVAYLNSQVARFAGSRPAMRVTIRQQWPTRPLLGGIPGTFSPLMRCWPCSTIHSPPAPLISSRTRVSPACRRPPYLPFPCSRR
jgi:SAM-dependent methyltransferase